MNWGIIISGFGLGTFKFLFAHWMLYGLTPDPDIQVLLEIFISVTAGAWSAMTLCYFSAGYLMKRARKKRQLAIKLAIENGLEFKHRKNFTRLNKAIVRIKRSLGIYGITLLAPLFLSIPIGSIVCAKFYGDKKRTFILMLIVTGSYSILMVLLMYLGI